MENGTGQTQAQGADIDHAFKYYLVKNLNTICKKIQGDRKSSNFYVI